MTLFRVALLLLYSLSPGIAKITSNSSWFIFGLLFFGMYLFNGFLNFRSDLEKNKKIEYWFLFFIFYATILNILIYTLNTADINAQLIGVGSFLMPLVMIYFWGRLGFKSYFWDDLLLVGFVHSLISLLIYEPIYQHLNFFDDIRSSLLNGAIPFRLSSVAGSAILSILMVSCYAVALNSWISNPSFNRHKKILLLFQITLFAISAILTMQRAALVGVLLISLTVILTNNGRRLIVLLICPLIIIVIIMYASTEIPADMIEIALSRVASIASLADEGAIGERAEQWKNLIEIIRSSPFGAGSGQLGQASRIAGLEFQNGAIYDGDPFRIIGEYSVSGLILIIVVLSAVFKSIKIIILTVKRRTILKGTLLASLCLSLVIQSFGTNITELYFVNSLFWIIIFLLKDSSKKFATQTLLFKV